MRLDLPLCFIFPAEGYAPAEPVTTCDPTPKPGVGLFRDWVMGQLGGADAGIARACDEGSASKHHEGRAWDWSPPDVATGQAVWEQLLERDAELARRAGLRTMIWAAVSSSGTREPTIWIARRGVEPYTGSSPHRDHIHFGFGWAGAMGQTSLFQALGGAPCPPLPSLPPQRPPPRVEPTRRSQTSPSPGGGVVVVGFAVAAVLLLARR